MRWANSGITSWAIKYFHKTIKYIINYMNNGGTAVAQWLRCCATNRKVAGSIGAGISEFFIDIILPIALRPCGRLSL